MAPTGSISTNESGIPLGNVLITGGPSKYDFLIEGLHIRGGGDHAGQQEFKLTYGEFVEEPVYIRVTSVRQMPAWLCPPWPGVVGETRHELLWSDAWEFKGFCPGEGVPVRGIYGTHSRKGVAHLWQAHVDDYGCDGAKRDLAAFFLRHNSREALLALERAMGHMARGSVVGQYHIDCKKCWELFKQLRLSCDLP